MIKTVRNLGDKLLSKFVPQLTAHAACTPVEHVCVCHPDVEGEYRNCWYEQLCNGKYREWGWHSIKGC